MPSMHGAGEHFSAHIHPLNTPNTNASIGVQQTTAGYTESNHCTPTTDNTNKHTQRERHRIKIHHMDTGGTNQGPAYYQECVSLFGKKVFMKPVNE